MSGRLKQKRRRGCGAFSELLLPVVKFFFQLLALFAAEPKSINLTHIAGGGEGVNALLFHPSQQFTEFFVAEQNFEFDALFPAIAANNLVECTPAVKMIDDELTNPFVILRHDTDPFAFA